MLTAIDENLASILVQSEGNSEILVVQAKVGNKDLRIINGYGTQEDENIQQILNFWQDMEKEIISAKDNNCQILIQLDANAKLGSDILPQLTNQTSGNGRVMMEMIRRHNL